MRSLIFFPQNSCLCGVFWIKKYKFFSIQNAFKKSKLQPHSVYKVWKETFLRYIYFPLFPLSLNLSTIVQSMLNTKLSQQTFRQCHETGLDLSKWFQWNLTSCMSISSCFYLCECLRPIKVYPNQHLREHDLKLTRMWDINWIDFMSMACPYWRAKASADWSGILDRL